jgi:hypothetical protein
MAVNHGEFTGNMQELMLFALLMREEWKIRKKMKEFISGTIRRRSKVNDSYNRYTGILVKFLQSLSMSSTFRSMTAKLVHKALLNYNRY